MQIKSKRLDALAAVSGRVSAGNSKMPGSTFALDAFGCKVGSKLAAVAGSTCAACYARRLQQFRGNLQIAWPRNQRLAVERIATDPEGWASDVSEQIRAIALMTGEPYHRWFDSGDLQSVAMLAAICRVAELLPDVRFWLPTREVAMVRAYTKAGGKVPSNLVIRLSAPMIDQAPLSGWPHTSTVHKTRELGEGEHACPARTQGNSCGECRACWSPDVASVSYHKH